MPLYGRLERFGPPLHSQGMPSQDTSGRCSDKCVDIQPLH